MGYTKGKYELQIQQKMVEGSQQDSNSAIKINIKKCEQRIIRIVTLMSLITIRHFCHFKKCSEINCSEIEIETMYVYLYVLQINLSIVVR